jgi:hypothetical protein
VFAEDLLASMNGMLKDALPLVRQMEIDGISYNMQNYNCKMHD